MEASAPAPPPPPAAGAAPIATGAYPVRVDAEHQAEYNRFLPLVKWLLIIPHVVVLAFVFIGVFFATIYAFFAVLFTGSYPRGVFDFITGTYRWSWRVSSYAGLLHDQYPPFSLEPDPDYPATFEVEYPEEGVDRWRPLVHWLLIIPFAIIAGLLSYLAGAMIIIGIFVILFTGKLPEGMFKLILIPMRWQLRSYTYAHFLVTRYPPFDWDE
jgi:hypothetical protein